MDKNEVLAWLKRRGTRRNVEGLARYGIKARRPLGVPMGTLQSLSERLGKNHALAADLWKSGWYEARLLAALVDDPKQVTRKQMDAWAAGFENWGDCDTVCFTLFDRTPFAWEKVRRWAASPREFVKRAAFALLASLALHDKAAPDAQFRPLLPLIEKGARDNRNFVKKGVSWALRGVGRRSLALNAAALTVARRLAQSKEPAPRWVGKDALRDLERPKVRAQLARRARGKPTRTLR
ncbi:MAG: DNA alkylation repair protein [Candidatus Acidiferrales bacterium]